MALDREARIKITIVGGKSSGSPSDKPAGRVVSWATPAGPGDEDLPTLPAAAPRESGTPARRRGLLEFFRSKKKNREETEEQKRKRKERNRKKSIAALKAAPGALGKFVPGGSALAGMGQMAGTAGYGAILAGLVFKTPEALAFQRASMMEMFPGVSFEAMRGLFEQAQAISAFASTFLGTFDRVKSQDRREKLLMFDLSDEDMMHLNKAQTRADQAETLQRNAMTLAEDMRYWEQFSPEKAGKLVLMGVKNSLAEIQDLIAPQIRFLFGMGGRPPK